jgi:hypothetical protein
MNALLPAVIHEQGLQLTIAGAEGLSIRRDEALTTAMGIMAVADAEENDAAIGAIKAIAAVEKELEEARKSVKAPLLDLGRKLDGACERFKAELTREKTRLSRMAGDFAQLEDARSRAAAEKVRLVEEQIARDRLRQQIEAEDRAAQESKRIDRERLEAIAAAKSHDDLDAAQAVADQKQRELSEAELTRRRRLDEEATQRLADLTTVAAPARADGQINRIEWDVVVSDVHALYRANPGCVKLTPIMTTIKEALTLGVRLPGVIANRVTSVSVRTDKPIDV